MKAGALKAAKKLLKPETKGRVDPFEVVSRARNEFYHDVMPHHTDVELVERAHDPRFYLFGASWRPQQRQLLVMDTDPLSIANQPRFATAVAPSSSDMPMHLGGVFPAYLTSMLVMFIQAATRPEPPHLLAVEGRLDRLERAVRWVTLERVDEKSQVDWDQLQAALLKAAEALGWKAEWTMDRDKAEVVGKVSGVDYSQLARQRLDFYEQIASAVDKETFKAMSFELEPAE